MRVISRRALVDFWTRHPSAQTPMSAWFKVVSGAAFTKFADVKQTFNSADRVGEFVVFDVGGGYRIVTVIHFNRGRIYLRHVLTHREYDRWTSAQRGKR
jgi:mRNA interferase HigB